MRSQWHTSGTRLRTAFVRKARSDSCCSASQCLAVPCSALAVPSDRGATVHFDIRQVSGGRTGAVASRTLRDAPCSVCSESILRAS